MTTETKIIWGCKTIAKRSAEESSTFHALAGRQDSGRAQNRRPLRLGSAGFRRGVCQSGRRLMCGPADNIASPSSYSNQITTRQSPEERLADALRRELGIQVNPQALRMFIRMNWALVSKAALK